MNRRKKKPHSSNMLRSVPTLRPLQMLPGHPEAHIPLDPSMRLGSFFSGHSHHFQEKLLNYPFLLLFSSPLLCFIKTVPNTT